MVGKVDYDSKSQHESDFDLPPIEFNEFWQEVPDELKKD
jgi:hypothetical protein